VTLRFRNLRETCDWLKDRVSHAGPAGRVKTNKQTYSRLWTLTIRKEQISKELFKQSEFLIFNQRAQRALRQGVYIIRWDFNEVFMFHVFKN
jgi:hypothetical protein